MHNALPRVDFLLLKSRRNSLLTACRYSKHNMEAATVAADCGGIAKALAKSRFEPSV